MAVSYVGIGSAPNDGTGDTLRVGFNKINDNFSGLYQFVTNPIGYSPTGVLTPEYVGQEVFQISGNAWFKAINTSITGWSCISNDANDVEDWGTIP